ncbi:MAG TPA: transglutaminase domain-containing protein, partial [Gemmataceae bacterium]|nr:transglutaminase domain-containing protein [Gemmataceae bacterium]
KVTKAAIAGAARQRPAGVASWRLPFSVGVLSGLAIMGIVLVVLGFAAWHFWPATNSNANGELAAELEAKRKQIADARKSAEADAANIARLRELLEATEAKYRAEIAELKNAAKSQLKTEERPKQVAEKPGPEPKKPAEVDSAALAKIKDQVAEAKKKTDKDAAAIRLLRKELQAKGVKEEKYAYMDKHALAAPAQVEQSLESLVEYLTGPALDDVERARAIYRWIVDRIKYDPEAKAFDSTTPSDAKTVLARRMASCAGFASLFEDLGKRANLEAETILGDSRLIRKDQNDFGDMTHAWNMVKLNGEWRLLDATWGSHLGSQKKRIDAYFLAPPECLIFNHRPYDAKHQLLNPPVSNAEFQQLSKLAESDLIRFGLFTKETFALVTNDKTAIEGLEKILKSHPRVLEMGVAFNELLATAKKTEFREFVRVHEAGGAKVTVLKAPLQKHLIAGQVYRFQLRSDSVPGCIVSNAGEGVVFNKNGDLYECEFKAKKGTLIVGVVKTKKSDKKGSTNYDADVLLEYEVQ